MFVSIGEALIDSVKTGNEVKTYIGGGPLNTAYALACLNNSSAFFGEISTDSYGKKIVDFLINSFVIFDPLLCNSEKKSMISHVDNNTEPPKYSIQYENTSVFDLKLDNLLTALSVHSNIDVIISGSVYITDENSINNLISVLNSYSKSLFYLDLNIRLSVIKNMDVYFEKIIPLINRAHFIHASHEDLYNLKIDLKDFLNLINHNFLYTCGDNDSSWYIKQEKICSEKVIKMNGFKSSVGCGDVFNAAVLSYLKAEDLLHANLKIKDCKKALSFANTAASLNTLYEGVKPPTMDEVMNEWLK